MKLQQIELGTTYLTNAYEAKNKMIDISNLFTILLEKNDDLKIV